MGGKRFFDKTHPIKVAETLDSIYDFVASFTVANSTTDYDLKAQQATAFKNVPRAWLLVIWTDQDITIKLNNSGYPAITVLAGDSPFEFRNILEITNVYITNVSGSTANIKVMMV